MSIRKIMTHNAHAIAPGTSVSQVAEKVLRSPRGRG